MEDQDEGQNLNSPNQTSSERNNEPVRSRWSPKPEQILILESIFNSGMVNPPKDETVRIRKLLEKFGSVGDANVFYWFQNRRSRSRRRQRQIQANLAGNNQPQSTRGGAIEYGNSSNNICFAPPPFNPSYVGGSSSEGGGGGGGVCDVGGGGGGSSDDILLFSSQMGFPEMDNSSVVPSIFCSSDTSNLQYQSGLITVIINGVATEVPKGVIDMKAMFGEDVILVHSSGIPIPVNEFGFLLQSLEHGETYFLVSRTT